MGILDMIRRKQESGSRKFYGAVLDAHVLDQDRATDDITKDKDYFSIRLCEMFLKDKTNYISGYIPMAVALNIFNYAGRQCDIPVLVGNQMLQAVEKYVKDQDIEFRNVPVIGPIPYTGADVSLFVGLYRMQVDNLAKNLFSLIDNIIGAFNLTDLSAYLGIANRIGDGLANLIGLPQIDMRFGCMDTFGSSTNPFRDRYLLFINSPEERIDLSHIWVKDGRLREGATVHSAVPFTSYDYCLVRIEKLTNRPDIDSLPFHGIFIDIKTKIWEGSTPEAERLFLTLMRDLAGSPDLTTEDRSALMKTYLANYRQEKENHAAMTGMLRRAGTSSTRSAVQQLPATAMIQKTAKMAENIPINKNTQQAVQASLYKLTQYWNQIPHLQKVKQQTKLDSDMLTEQFIAVKSNQMEADADPQALADAICFASIPES